MRRTLRPQVPKLASISMAELRQADLLRDGRSKLVRWTNGVEIVIHGGSDYIYLGNLDVKLITTPANLGGTQQWLECPQCRTKRRRLFFHEGIWACADCHNVTTPAQLLLQPYAKAQRELAKYAERAATLPAWRLKRSAHRIPKLIEKLKGMK